MTDTNDTSGRRRQEKPRRRTAAGYRVCLRLDQIEWLRAHPDGPAAVAQRIIQREMERERARP